MSKARRMSAILLVLIAFTATPFAQAQDSIQNPNESTPTTLYFHIFDTVNKFVINTQAMNSEFFEVGGANFPTVPGTGTPTPLVETGVNVDEGYDMNTIYGYSTAGPVEYEFIENGKPRFHPERGIAADVEVDASVQPIAYIYFDVRDAFGGSTAPSAMPEFAVRLTLQEGDDPGLNANLDEGKDLMIGETQFQLMRTSFEASPGGLANSAFCTVINCPYFCGDFGAPCLAEGGPAPDTGVPVSAGDDALGGQSVGDKPILVPDENGIVEVQLPLEVLEDTIPKKEAYNVRLDWYQLDEVLGEDEFSQGWIRLASDPEHLTRLELNIMNPIYFSFIHPQVAGGSLLIHAGGNSPWGTYDVDMDAVTIEVTHESGKKVPDAQLKKLVNSNEHVHGLHDEDAQLTYLWDFRDNGAELGEYTIDMSLTNDANSAVATGSAKFIVSETEAIGVDTSGQVVEPTTGLDSDEVDTPSAGLVPMLALLGAALVIARRRWSE